MVQSRIIAQTAALAVVGFASACDSGSAACVNPPCAIPLAIQLTVADSVTGKAIGDASVSFSGVESGQMPCALSGICNIAGTSGTYTLDVTATGYRTARQQVVVSGASAPACGCASADTQHLTLVLAPTG